MIELSPKALRFARLAAEEFPGVDRSCVADLKRQETDHLASLSGDTPNQPAYLSISDELARFCLKSILTVLERRTASKDEWDENDLLFLRAVSTHLSDSLLGGRKA